jgi:hypothetical protein
MKLFAAIYFILLGYGIAKKDVDKKVYTAAVKAYESFTRHTARIMLEENDKYYGPVAEAIKNSDAAKGAFDMAPGH